VGTIETVESKYKVLSAVLNERQRRLWAASEAKVLGRGGVSWVSRATGLSRTTITGAMKELEALECGTPVAEERVRRPGGGRKPLTETDPGVMADLERLVEPTTCGDPQSALRWTCKSTRKLAADLRKRGHEIGERKVAQLLDELNYSLQSNRKSKEGGDNPDRNAQFEYINRQAQRFQRKEQPVISVDAKKKELIGDFRNAGKEWRPQGHPEAVRVYDFMDKKLGKGIPYGVYDVSANRGWVSVGTDHDTAEFAVETIRRWWHKMGHPSYPMANELLIMADGGGSNGSRTRLWKIALQGFADETGLAIRVCHFPPGTSKWNKIEHRMFCHITQNWRGRPLVSHEVMVNLIGNTTTEKGLAIKADLDTNCYPTGIKVSDDQLAEVNLKRAAFHGEWNYQISPSFT
jgi:hypothetical protein